jgi:uncharacterized protein with PIN domain
VNGDTPGEPERRPIPPELFSEHDEAPFSRCSDCGGSLDATASPHVIGKTWRDDEVVFEFAICMACATVLYSGYSEESKARLADYFGPVAEALRGGWTSCARCGRGGADTAAERSVEAVALGRDLVAEPIMICGPCADGADAVLSEATRNSLDDFMRRVCPTLPADLDLPAPVFSIP